MAVIDAGPGHQIELLQATIEALDLWADWWERRPFRGLCPRCGRDVVVVWLFGEDAVLEVVEVLATMRCPRCAANVAQGKLGTDPRARPCWRCRGTHFVGQEVPSVGVALAEDGSARPFTGERGRGEAVCVPHRCTD